MCRQHAACVPVALIEVFLRLRAWKHFTARPDMQTTSHHSTVCHQLTQGQMLTLQLAEGSTLTCLSSSIEIQSTALPSLDAFGGYSLRLRTGQSWRAPGMVWVQLQSLESSARVELQVTQAQEKCPSLESMGHETCRPERSVLAYSKFTLARLWTTLFIKRGRRAA